MPPRPRRITQTVLKQNPDLCGIVGFWDGMDIGTAAAIKEAGLTGKVFLATSGGGEQKGACDQVKNGSFDLDLSYDVPTQASTDGRRRSSGCCRRASSPARSKGSKYTTLIPITKDNADSRRPAGISATSRSDRRMTLRGPGLQPGDRAPDFSMAMLGMPMRDTLTRLRYRYWPDHLLGEILVQALDRDRHPGDRAADRRLCAQPLASTTSCRRRASPTPRGRPARSASSSLGMALVVIVGGIDLSVGSIFALTDFCALYLLDVLKLAGPGRGGRHAALRRAARRRQRRADRLSPAARLHHHADHADHLPLGLRSADPALLQRDRRRPSPTFRPGTSSAAATCSACRRVALVYIVDRRSSATSS